MEEMELGEEEWWVGRPESRREHEHANGEDNGHSASECSSLPIGPSPPLQTTGKGTTKLLWWGSGHVVTKEVYQLVQRWRLPVQKVVKVSQKDGQIRFDLTVQRTDAAGIQARTAALGRRGHMRTHNEERLRRMPKPTPTPPTIRQRRQWPQGKNWTVISLNVAGLRTKKTEVESLLERTKADFVLLQETNRKPHHWPIKLAGFQVFDVAGDGSKHSHGLALAVRRSSGVAAYLLTNTSASAPYIQSIRVYKTDEVDNLPLPNGGLILSTVYRPKAPEWRSHWRSIGKTIRRHNEKHRGTTHVVCGDMNWNDETLARQLEAQNLSGSITRRFGLRETRRDPRSGHLSQLDAAITFENDAEMPVIMCSTTMHEEDISDHLPQKSYLRQRQGRTTENAAVQDKTFDGQQREHPEIRRASKAALAPEEEETGEGWRVVGGLRMRRTALTKIEETAQIRNDNRWTSLSDNDSADVMATKFEETTGKLARENNLLQGAEGERGQQRGHRWQLAEQALRRRRKAKVAARTDPDDPMLKEKVVEATKQAKSAVRNYKAAMIKRAMMTGIQKFGEGDSKGGWRWLRRIINGAEAHDNQRLPPITDPVSGRLALSDSAKGLAWARHYAQLAAPPPPAMHRQVMPSDPLPPAPEDINGEITWDEICETLNKRMARGKACGADGIPTEWLAMASDRRDPESGEYPNEPSSEMGKALLNIINKIWLSGEVPSDWATALVVSLHKKGSRTDPGNYRGISLMSHALKLLTTIVSNRLYTYLEDNNIMAEEQAGFRNREEAVAQAAVLAEVMRRRKLMGHKTYVAFIDQRKAYDTVVHDHLMYKLQHYGVHGTMLNFIQNLYKASRIAIATQSGDQFSFEMRRGVRQGCPLSTTLFNVYINDLPDYVKGNGVEVPTDDDTFITDPDGAPKSMGALMFADDVAVLSDSPEGLQHQVEMVNLWCQRWGMAMATKKCAVMSVPRTGEVTDPLEVTVDGERIPEVDEYCYLGVMIDNGASVERMVAHRQAILGERLAKCKPLLLMQDIPLGIRALVLRAVAMPTGSYGGEIWGGYEELTKGMDGLIDRNMATMCNSEFKGRVPAGLARYEFGVPSITAIASALMVRLASKAPNMRTWMRDLVHHPLSPDRAAMRRERRLWSDRAKEAFLATREWATRVRFRGPPFKGEIERQWQRLRETLDEDKAITTTLYLRHGLTDSSTWFRRYKTTRVDIAEGLSYLSALRLRALMTARQRAQQGRLPPRFLTACPFCGKVPAEGMGETHSHMLVECGYFNNIRETTIGRALARLRAEVGRSAFLCGEDNEEDAVGSIQTIRRLRQLLVGGKIRFLAATVGNDIVMSDGAWNATSGRLAPAAPGAPRADREATSHKVAAFLQRVMPRRKRVLRRLEAEWVQSVDGLEESSLSESE